MPGNDEAPCAQCGSSLCEGTHRCTCNRYPHTPACGKPWAPFKTDQIGVCWHCGGRLTNDHRCPALVTPPAGA